MLSIGVLLSLWYTIRVDDIPYVGKFYRKNELEDMRVLDLFICEMVC